MAKKVRANPTPANLRKHADLIEKNNHRYSNPKELAKRNSMIADLRRQANEAE